MSLSVPAPLHTAASSFSPTITSASAHLSSLVLLSARPRSVSLLADHLFLRPRPAVTPLQLLRLVCSGPWPPCTPTGTREKVRVVLESFGMFAALRKTRVQKVTRLETLYLSGRLPFLLFLQGPRIFFGSQVTGRVEGRGS